MSIIEKVFGTHSDRELKRIEPIVKKIESYRDEMGKLTDEELRAEIFLGPLHLFSYFLG